MELYGLKKISSSCQDLHEACPYTLEKVIQKGKNCVRVIKSIASETNETVAIKLFPKNRDGQPLNAYLNEQKFLTGLSHSHILKYQETYHDAVIQVEDGKFSEYSAIVMEYIPFGDLFGLISKKPCSEKLARTIFRQMVSAISYLHQQDIAHLDLKPENFLVDPKQGVKLIDFEACQKITSGEKAIAKGTPGYRAPEVVKEEFEDVKALDVYSLGVVLFTMVAGTVPYVEAFEGGKWKFDRYYDALRNDARKFWGAHERHRTNDGKECFSSEFKAAFESMLDADPEKRPTVENIMRLKWCQGEVYSDDELEMQLTRC